MNPSTASDLVIGLVVAVIRIISATRESLKPVISLNTFKNPLI